MTDDLEIRINEPAELQTDSEVTEIEASYQDIEAVPVNLEFDQMQVSEDPVTLEADSDPILIPVGTRDYNDLLNKPLTNGTDRLDADKDIYVDNEKLAKESQIPSLDPYRTAAAQDLIDAQKQPVINDLSSIRSGASAGATAIQPGANVSQLTNDAGYLTLQTLPRWDGN